MITDTNVHSALDTILDWLYQKHGTDMELKIGIWSDSELPNYYAIVSEAGLGSPVAGESTYGSPRE